MDQIYQNKWYIQSFLSAVFNIIVDDIKWCAVRKPNIPIYESYSSWSLRRKMLTVKASSEQSNNNYTSLVFN